MAKELRFTPALFDFLRELKANNNREWFEANKPRYLADVREPFLAFIAALRPRLQNLSPHYVVEPKCMFRIYRDTRFAKDKTPYKTAASAYFWHQAGKLDTPGFYLHMEPGDCFVGMGLYEPAPALRNQVVAAIAANADEWRGITGAKEFKKQFTFSGDALQRVPKPYGEDQTLAPVFEDLKRKSFIVVAKLNEKQVCASDFLDRYEALCTAGAPLVAFLTRAVGLPWSATDKGTRKK
ncbi:MAG: TIGR02453 family protein [Acidobacteria bacterium]|nr:TIGR02453 family protein [Acidobacteriota bacterium]MBI3425961.1 TIGR02453 family protein [Acidobacteriota bacterium]